MLLNILAGESLILLKSNAPQDCVAIYAVVTLDSKIRSHPLVGIHQRER